VEPAANDLDRELRHDGKTVKGAARDAARHARVAASQEVHKLIADVEDLVRRVGNAADPELARLRAKVESTVATTKKAISDGTDQVQRQAKEALERKQRLQKIQQANAPQQPSNAPGVAAPPKKP